MIQRRYKDLDWRLVVFILALPVFAYFTYHMLRFFVFPSQHSRAVVITSAFILGALLLWAVVILFFISLQLLVEPLNSVRFNKYLSAFRRNIPSEVVIVLAYPNWRLFKGWYKVNFTSREMESIIRYVTARRQKFSVYAHASREDIEVIMRDPTIKEVYFCGHGDSHTFMLSTDKFLYYCEFNREEHGKEYIHQVHCGTPDGKRLIDYVVPPENRDKCFWYDRSITAWTIRRTFDKWTEAVRIEQMLNAIETDKLEFVSASRKEMGEK